MTVGGLLVAVGLVMAFVGYCAGVIASRARWLDDEQRKWAQLAERDRGRPNPMVAERREPWERRYRKRPPPYNYEDDERG
jgi:hypothetical protein